jgi:poly-gamma-glutamate capsule biosynthesis protein CapA/YwtB (metallophosphatase superfamily)
MKKVILILFLLLKVDFLQADSLTIIFAGDTHFGENYQYSPKFNRGVNIIKEEGYDYFFENVGELLKNANAVIVNLETPLVNTNVSGKIPSSYLKPYLHWSSAEDAPVFFRKYNILAVNLGNNHSMDYGTSGLDETMFALNSNGISYFGAGADSTQAAEPFIKDFNDFKLAVFGGFEFRQKYDTLYDFYAENNKPGVNRLDAETLTGQIEEYRNKYPEIFIVIYPHWGKNYKPAGADQKDAAHKFIDAGADMVIGHGAHTIQEIEYYKGRWILYNTGNFIFNAPGRYSSTGAKPYGFITQLNFTDKQKTIRLYPVFTENHKTDYRLRYLDEDESEDCYKFLLNDNIRWKIKKSSSGIFELLF